MEFDYGKELHYFEDASRQETICAANQSFFASNLTQSLDTT
jgi:hypothetical protein